MTANQGRGRGGLRDWGLSDEDLQELGYKVTSPRPAPVDVDGLPLLDPLPKWAGGAGGDRKKWAIATLVILCAVAWGAGPKRVLPDPVPVGASETGFSSGRATVQLSEIARIPRPMGSPEHDRVRNYLVEQLTTLGLEPRVQTTLSHAQPGDSGLVVSAVVHNVVARLPGTSAPGAVLLTAPYDGGTASPAASDGAFGLATILEVLRVLTTGPPLQGDVIVAFVDGSQVGSLGARAFVEEHEWAEDVTAVLTLDARGATGPVFAFETGETGPHGLMPQIGAGVRPGPSSLMRALLGSTGDTVLADRFPGGSAHGVSLLALGNPSTPGLPWDSAGSVSERTLQHAGTYLLSAVRSLAGAPQPSLEESVFFPLPFVGLVEYAGSWVPWITLSLVAVFVLLGLFLRFFRRGSWKALLLGLVAGLLPVALSAGLAGWLLAMASPLHQEHGWVGGAFYRDGPYILAVFGIAVASVSAVHGIARLRARRDELLLGALLGPLGLCVWLTFSAPLAAYAVQWPLALGMLGAVGVTVAGPVQSRSDWAWGVLIVLSVAIVVVAVPSLELVAGVWTFKRAASLGALFALALLTLTPMMEWALRPRAAWLPTVALAVTAVLAYVAVPGESRYDEHPDLSALVYLTDEPAPTLPSIRGPGAAAGDSPGQRLMVGQWLTVPGPEGDWVRSWLDERQTGSTDPGVLLLPHEEMYEIAGPAPNGSMAPPRARIVGTALDGARRTVRVGLDSHLGGGMVGFHVPEGVDARIVGIEGTSGGRSFSPVRSLAHWGTGPREPTVVALSLGPAVRELELIVLEHHLRPPEVLGHDFFDRPETVIPNPKLGSDRLIQRTTLRLALPDPGLRRGGLP